MDELFQRSLDLEERVVNILRQPLYDTSDRVRVSHIMCSVSLEHSASFKILLSSQNFTSAIGLLRLQFESYVRGLWILYAASEIALSKLAVELTHDSAKKANKIPMLGEMIKQLEVKAQKNAVDPILEFREHQWQPLSSYVHGGLHAIDRHSKGYPLPLIYQALKSSNGLVGLAAILSSILTGQQNLIKESFKMHDTYFGCFILKSD